MSNNNETVQFINCYILRNHKIIKEDLWVRNGKILNPEVLFYEEQIGASRKYDCQGHIIAPGFIDLQINGGYGHDFSYNVENLEQGLNLVCLKLLEDGVTAFCPTLVTSPRETYHKVCTAIKKRPGGSHGAAVLGIHAEGPFISFEKKGAHTPSCIKTLEKGFDGLVDIYGNLENIKIVTLAPELENSSEVIKKLTANGIIVSVGHSKADISQGEEAVNSGATLITHLFNAMLPFHHRDPGLVGLLTSDRIPKDKTVYFGIISDGIHTHPAALRIAYRVHPKGLILVTDALSALGLEDGKHNLGLFDLEIKDRRAFIAKTNTLAGSISSMIECVREFLKATGCSLEYALEAASLHPAQALNIEDSKGNLNYGSDADFIIITEKLDLISTWIAGQCVYKK